MSRIPITVSHDLSRGFLIGLIALLIVIPGVFLLIVLLYANQQREISDTFLIVATSVWASVFFGGLILFVGLTNYKRKKWLDSVFAPLGLRGQRYMINWWEYRGNYVGRELTARFYKGPTLDLILSTSVKTRFGVTSPNELSTYWSNGLRTPVRQINLPGLPGVNNYTLDESWFNRLLADPDWSNCLARLLTAGNSWALIQQVILSPGQLKMTLYRNKNLFNYDFNAGEVKNWVDDLVWLLQALEAAPTPLITAEATDLENAARSGKLTRRVVLITLAVMMLLSLCIGLAIWFLVRFGG